MRKSSGEWPSNSISCQYSSCCPWLVENAVSIFSSLAEITVVAFGPLRVSERESTTKPSCPSASGFDCHISTRRLTADTAILEQVVGSSVSVALRNIVTGIALNNVFTTFLGGLTFFTLIVAHSTFCIVVVYNNVIARLRRMGTSLQEASMDLGANGIKTFINITLPNIGSALFAGALLAFGLSFDEIVVTTFTAGPGIATLPIWIYNNLFRPNQAPIVNVVAAVLVLVSVLPSNSLKT